ncbi:MAG TPA: circadian clock KaiB family protein [Puia sp.]|jgi:circadian clock protein KaiB
MENNEDPNMDIDVSIPGRLVLQLFVSGMSANSMQAIGNIQRICAGYAKDQVDLEIIDIYKNPSLAKEQQIIFTPSLVRLLPLPKRTFIGNLSDTKKLVTGLGIHINE